ncbi:hypothetical protein QYE76_018963 [Lolium multiflorum]|uniref:Uncharacterized protein n=1 Tax=Lolium multiflorum TaxID=4521 RepID=A0AAD8QGR3_LOLMU|nr:hypothetical protein QYE76_018963 [Lolium multiflorum]
MSGRLDPTRTSRIALTKAQVAHRVNNITQANMPEDWAWGLPPYDRAAPPERVSRRPRGAQPAAFAGAVGGGGGGAGHVYHGARTDPGGALRTRPPAASATSAPKKKRAAGGNTARLEGKAKRQRQQEPKKVPEMAGAAIKFTQGGSSGPAARCAAVPPAEGADAAAFDTCAHAARCRCAARGYAACGFAASAGVFFSCASFSATAGAQGESAQGPTLGDLFRIARRCWGRLLEPAAMCPRRGTGAGGAAPPEGPEVVPTGPAARLRPEPPRTGAARRSRRARMSPTGLHVAKGARLAWNQADTCEIISREGQPGTAPLKMLYSGYRASLKSKATEALAQLKTLEDADKVGGFPSDFLCGRRVPQGGGPPGCSRSCAESEEAGRAAAAKLRVADGELRRLRALEKNHLAELTSLRAAEKEKVDDLSRRLDEVEKQRLALQEEVTDKSTELTATAKHWTDLIGAIDTGFRGRATGEGSSATFTMEDHLSSLAARVEPITKFGWELRKAAEELVPMLWPDKEAPQDISSLTSLIEQASDRFIDWKGSATRAGADMALSFVLSWYNEVDLGQLEYRRAGVEEELSADQKAARLARASAIADFVDKRLFIADPNPHSDEEEELEDEGVEMDSPPPAVDRLVLLQPVFRLSCLCNFAFAKTIC